MADALAVCLVYLDADPGPYDTARWSPGTHALPRAAPAADEAQPVLAALRALARHSRPAATETLLQPPASCNLEARRAVLAVGSGAWPLIGWTDGRPPGLLSAKVIGERSGFYGETRPTGATRAA